MQIAISRTGAASTLRGAARGVTRSALPACTCAYPRYRALATTSSQASPPIEVESPSHQLADQPLSSSSNPLSEASSQQSSQHTVPSSHDSTSALSLLRSQPSHYVVASLYSRRYLLTPRDVLTVPRLKDVQVGDVIDLQKIHELGSRDYTLRAGVDEVLGADIVKVDATVVEHTKAQMEETVKFKRRKGYLKTIKTKAMYTRLRVGDIIIGGQA